MEKITQIEILKRRLIARGYVTNWEFIDERISTRLGALICRLREFGWVFDGEYIPNTKNFKYTLISAPDAEIERIQKIIKEQNNGN